MDLLKNLIFPQKSIYNDILKWHDSSELRDESDRRVRRRTRIFNQFDRYVVELLDDTEVKNEENKSDVSSFVSLISLQPWFDENKHLEYANDLINKKTYTTQFEHVFNAVIAHFILKHDFEHAIEFMERVFDQAVDDDHKNNVFYTFIPDTQCFYHRVFNIMLNKNILIMKYHQKHPNVKIQDYILRAICNNLVHARNGENDLSRDTLKTINQLLRKYPNRARHAEIATSHSICVFHYTASPEIMIQTLESNQIATQRILSELDEFWNSSTVDALKECYTAYPDRFNNALLAFFLSKTKTYNIKNKAWLLHNLDKNTPFLDVANNILPKLPDDFQAEYLLLNI